MSELIQKHDNRATIRWKLLTSASALALTVTVSSANPAKAEDSDRPPVWIELGGQFVMLGDAQQRYAPPFFSLFSPALPSPLALQKPPAASFDWTGKISFEPDGSDWVFSAAVRYGRSSTSNVQPQKTAAVTNIMTSGGGTTTPWRGNYDYENGKSHQQEAHAILDFMAGKDVGLGMFGGTTGVLSGGVRVAQFTSHQTESINAAPDYHSSSGNNIFNGAAQAKRSFHGIGPSISWDASTPIAGNEQDGLITLDWGANGAMLFGRRKANIDHGTSECHQRWPTPSSSCTVVYNTAGNFKRSRRVTVPNLGGFAGISWRYSGAKVSFGYRGDFFFGAMDVGNDAQKAKTLGFFGPYASISIGLGD